MGEIKLIKSSFYKEEETKREICSFILNSNKFSMGDQCLKFEKNFSKFQRRKYSIFVTSGSAANLVLIQSLLNLKKLKRGDKVGVSALTWSTNIMPLIELGLIPVLIDCELDTLNISLNKVKEKKIDALFITNALGFCSDIDKIKDYCNEKKILFFEDNCESLGTEYKGKLLGNFGIASTFSFFVGHHLSTIEGGMICTDNKELYENLIMTRIHGWSRNLSKKKQKELQKKYRIDDFYNKYTFYELAYNARPTEINGFIGNVQMNYLKEIIDRREKNFKMINEQINSNPDLLKINVKGLTKISNFGIPLIFKDKVTFKRYKKKFEKNNVEIRPIISGNMANQPFFKKFCKKNSSICPNAEFIHNHGFYCGNNPEMSEEEIKFIINLISNGN
jgi:CDP-6-deoxy-D-xylo-4-hexulose-3-dehydrase